MSQREGSAEPHFGGYVFLANSSTLQFPLEMQHIPGAAPCTIPISDYSITYIREFQLNSVSAGFFNVFV